MAQAERGDTVRVEYTGKLEDGTVFDSSEDREPLEFTIGEDEVIPGFEAAVMGMSPGDSATAELGPEEAYGERREDLVFDVDRDEISGEVELEVGDEVELHGEDGSTVPAIIVGLDESSVTLDANHPLAGRTLVFDVELVSIL